MPFGSWLKRFRRTDRFNVQPALQRMPRCFIRPLAVADVEECCAIYRLNAPGRFPDGYFDEFRDSLTSPAYMYLVAESAKSIFALGAVCFAPDVPPAPALAFGMVHPGYHRRGFGTALLVTRLASLAQPDSWERVYITTVGDSASFYSRHGFRYLGKTPDASMKHEFDAYYTIFAKRDWMDCRRLIADSDIDFDVDGVSLPSAQATPNSALERTRKER